MLLGHKIFRELGQFIAGIENFGDTNRKTDTRHPDTIEYDGKRQVIRSWSESLDLRGRCFVDDSDLSNLASWKAELYSGTVIYAENFRTTELYYFR